MTRDNQYETIQPTIGAYIKWSVISITVVILLGILFLGGCREFNRYQKRADAKNKITVANYGAKRVHAEIQATIARAEKRVEEAKGIKEAQRLIAGSLTPLYIQHEAIDAQRHGNGGDRTYIPVGPQGVPLVADVNDQASGEIMDLPKLLTYEVHVVERVERIYTVPATSDINAEEQVQNGEVDKFKEVNANIDEVLEVKRV